MSEPEAAGPRADFVEIDARMRPVIERAWEGVEAEIEALPMPLRALGWAFLRSRRSPKYRDYFSDMTATPLLYLPLWFGEGLARAGTWAPELDADERLVELTQATMWGYFYIRIQDDLLDEARPSSSDALLANICYQRMASCHERVLGSSPGFRAGFEAAWLEFTNATLAEHEQLRSDRAYPRELFEAHAAKVSYARVPMLALCELSGRRELADDIATLVHTLGIAFGLLNDLRGFRRDLENGQRTHLLAECGWNFGDEVDEALRTKLYEGGLIAAFYDESQRHMLRAVELARGLGFGPQFEDYQQRHDAWLDARRQASVALSLSRVLSRL